ncbi:MAG: L,D-transpeptidase [Porticoccaceae bacterium]|nr:L,D-transpeptidase [Porticoccaceae bacterium]
MNRYKFTRKNIFAYFFRLSLVVFTPILFAPQICKGAEPTWVLVDTNQLIIKIMRDDTVIAEYDNISIGQRGAAELHLRGDETTPLGELRIMTIDHTSRYKLFFGLNYPTVRHARLALAQQQISLEGYQRITKAHSNGTMPPMDTVLGGAIGIHGIGSGSLSVHNQYNWTDGCVALNNDQIADFARWVKIGTRVLIR